MYILCGLAEVAVRGGLDVRDAREEARDELVVLRGECALGRIELRAHVRVDLALHRGLCAGKPALELVELRLALAAECVDFRGGLCVCVLDALCAVRARALDDLRGVLLGLEECLDSVRLLRHGGRCAGRRLVIPRSMAAATGAQDPVEALAAGLARATGGVYAVDVRDAAGLGMLAHVVDLIFVRRIVPPDVRDALAVHTPAALTILLAHAPAHAKLVAQCFASVYPRIFAYVCYDHSPTALHLWQLCTALRHHMAALLDAPHAGARIGAAKACQRIVQVQSAPAGDARAPTRTEVDLRSVPPEHPFLHADELAREAGAVLARLTLLMYTSTHVDLVLACVNVLARLGTTHARVRGVVIDALAGWTPDALRTAAAVHVRSAETTVRLALIHFLRHGVADAHAAAIDDALDTQRRRMDAARKRPHDAPDAPSKRHAPALAARAAAALAPPAPPTPVSAADVARMPVDRVIDVIIATLRAVPVAQLHEAVAAHARPEPGAPAAAAAPVDPLTMDVGDDELPPAAPPAPADDEYAPLVTLEHFHLPPPTPLAPAEAHALVAESVTRICRTGARAPDASGTTALWILLVTRLATRGLDVPVRELLFQHVTHDFVRRRPLAQQWLAEEWACDRARRGTPQYATWLARLVDTLVRDTRAREHALGAFLIDVPDVPAGVVDTLQALCLERDSLTHGFALLRDLCAARPPLRAGVCERVLALTRHRDRLVRGKAIVTARSWVLQRGALGERVLAYAHESLALVVEAARREWTREAGGPAARARAGGRRHIPPADAGHPGRGREAHCAACARAWAEQHGPARRAARCAARRGRARARDAAHPDGEGAHARAWAAYP